jgi:hypothetical protein
LNEINILKNEWKNKEKKTMNRLPYELVEIIATMIPANVIFDLSDFPLMFFTVRNNNKFERFLLKYLGKGKSPETIVSESDYFFPIHISNVAMVWLINNLLDFTRGKMTMKNFDDTTKFFLLFEHAYISGLKQSYIR